MNIPKGTYCHHEPDFDTNHVHVGGDLRDTCRLQRDQSAGEESVENGEDVDRGGVGHGMKTHDEYTGDKGTYEGDIEPVEVSLRRYKAYRMQVGCSNRPSLSADIPDMIRPAKDPAFNMASRLFDMFGLIPWASPYDGK